MTAPLEKAIKIILTSFECKGNVVNLRSSAFICGSFLMDVSEYDYYLRLMKKELHLNISFTMLSQPILTGITQRY